MSVPSTRIPRAITIPRSITIQHDDHASPGPSREKELRRQNSTLMTTGPVQVEGSSRIVGEFRLDSSTFPSRWSERADGA